MRLTPHITPHIIKKGDTLMSKWDKLLEKVCNLSNDVRFSELKKILESYGYELDRKTGGSHYVFRKKKSNPITIPKHGTIKKIYVKMVKEVIESEEDNEKD